jgi:hypothetical protein
MNRRSNIEHIRRKPGTTDTDFSDLVTGNSPNAGKNAKETGF